MSTVSSSLKVKGRLPWVLWVFMALEIAIGGAYFGVVHLATASPIFYLILDNLLTLLHMVMLNAAIGLALYHFHHKHSSCGNTLLGLFFSALVLKDFLITLASALLNENTGDALVTSLLSVLVNTLVIDGMTFVAITCLAFFIFLKRKPVANAPSTLFEKSNPLVPATLFVTCTYTLIHLIRFVVEFVEFGHAYFWILSVGEVLTAVADFLFILAGAMLAYITTHLCIDKFQLED